ncbi:TlpA disulfide reductase family protein [Mucilaginibacter sp. CAU 1740]|uniref:TlpA family protein disulfide reductase n=1 Tax=Mucilaginibacter sp. CAU 1740 TaxID=3140365 RepID=UPI00325C031A
MKTLLVSLFAVCLSAYNVVAQTAKIHVKVKNTTSAKAYYFWQNDVLGLDFLKKEDYLINLDKEKPAVIVVNIDKPQFITLRIQSSDIQPYQIIDHDIFLSPGDDISFKADFKSRNYGITVTGKGSENSQPMFADILKFNPDPFYGDTIPDRVIAAINKEYHASKNILNNYISTFKPSPAFIKSKQHDLNYFAAYQFYNFKEDNKFRVEKAYKSNYAKWQRITDSLFKTAPLDNDAAMDAANYRDLIRDFLLREKERLWVMSSEQPVEFFKQWYGADTVAGRKSFLDDNSNLLTEKIINKSFHGEAACFAYAALLNEALYTNNPSNLISIFERFKQQFPNSKYVDKFKSSIDQVALKQNRPVNESAVFLTDNGTKLNTFSEVLALAKGKTALIDMWGTWCGPCREEITKNAEALKSHFKGKDVIFFYVANYDIDNEKKWKDFIVYLGLDGTQILANTNLTKDVMTKVNSNGFPTYIVINKDGGYEQSKAGYPMKREVLIKQIETAMEK